MAKEKRRRRRRVKPIKKHRAIVDQNFGRIKAREPQLCQLCGVVHSKNQHRFHGKGSFDKTHGGV